MTMLVARALVLFAIGFTPAARPQAPIASSPPVNRDFEGGTDERGCPSGWTVWGEGYEGKSDAAVRHGGDRSARLRWLSDAPPAGKKWGALEQDLPAAAHRRRRLQFSGFLQVADVAGEGAGLSMRVDGPDGDVLAFDSMSERSIRGTADWQRCEITLDVPSSAVKISLGALLAGKGTVWFDDLSLIDVGPAGPEIAPGLFELRGEYEITEGRGAAGWLRSLLSTEAAAEADAAPTMLLPVPLSYREQVPLTYALATQPPDQLQSVRIYEHSPGNFVAEVTLKRLAPGAKIRLQWSSIVLCAPRSFDDVPAQAPMPKSWPDEATPWLASTPCAQAEDPRIRTVAQEIRGDRTDVREIVAATLERARRIVHSKRLFTASMSAMIASTSFSKT